MRELNPNLFENAPRPEWTESQTPKAVVPAETVSERQVLELARQVKMLEKIVMEQRAFMDEQNKMQTARTERMAQQIKNLDAVQTGSLKELNERLGSVMNKLSERRAVDAKMEDMVDRHNHIVQSFELKLKVLQKVLSERESQILKAMAQLEDARAEILRMKRL